MRPSSSTSSSSQRSATSTLQLCVVLLLALPLVFGPQGGSGGVLAQVNTVAVGISTQSATPTTTLDPSAAATQTTASENSHYSQGLASGTLNGTPTTGPPNSISTGLQGGYDTPTQTLTTDQGTLGGTNGQLQDSMSPETLRRWQVIAWTGSLAALFAAVGSVVLV